jgi:hypothetical protein
MRAMGTVLPICCICFNSLCASAQVCGTNTNTAILLSPILMLSEIAPPSQRQVYGTRFALALGAKHSECVIM